jgi:hypothetical protein
MLKYLLVPVALCALALGACSAPKPAASPSASPSPAASAPAAASPAASPTPLVLPPDAPPQIVAVELSDPIFHSGETISGTVITSTNVAAVDVRVAKYSSRLPQTAPGVFAVTYTLPKIPFFLRGAYTAQVIAQNGAGLTAERDVQVSLR